MGKHGKRDGDGYGKPTLHGTTVADERHVSEEEAIEALDDDQAETELPEADERFDDF